MSARGPGEREFDSTCGISETKQNSWTLSGEIRLTIWQNVPVPPCFTQCPSGGDSAEIQRPQSPNSTLCFLVCSSKA
ncbi:hypothetical protein XENTR_v10022841 [Xenopus tropicalis]|nr:hypothetical protein XENTR_v10022841 [Xenopus tropicalis]